MIEKLDQFTITREIQLENAHHYKDKMEAFLEATIDFEEFFETRQVIKGIDKCISSMLEDISR